MKGFTENPAFLTRSPRPKGSRMLHEMKTGTRARRTVASAAVTQSENRSACGLAAVWWKLIVQSYPGFVSRLAI
jgi:hypothetical protein